MASSDYSDEDASFEENLHPIVSLINHGNLEQLKRELNPETLTPEYDGETILRHAICSENLEILEFIVAMVLTHAPEMLDQPDSTGMVPIGVAMRTQNSKILERILEAITSGLNRSDVWTPSLNWNKFIPSSESGTHKSTPLHIAVRSRKEELVKVILKFGGDRFLLLPDHNQKTPLQLAFDGADLYSDCSDSAKLELIQVLISANSEQIDTLNGIGETGMHVMSRHPDSSEILKYLISNGSQAITIRNVAGKIPLQIAFEYGNLENAKTMLESIDAAILPSILYMMDNHCRTSFHWAAQSIDGFLLLMKTGVPPPPTIVGWRKETLLQILAKTAWTENKNPLLLFEAAYLNSMLNHGAKGRQAPLQLACEAKLEFNVMALLRAGADPKILDAKGNTLLHLSASFGRKEMGEILIPILPEFINAVDSEGRTPLHLAAQTANTPMIEMLLKWGATSSLDIRSAVGKLPIESIPKWTLFGSGHPDKILSGCSQNSSLSTKEISGIRSRVYFEDSLTSRLRILI